MTDIVGHVPPLPPIDLYPKWEHHTGDPVAPLCTPIAETEKERIWKLVQQAAQDQLPPLAAPTPEPEAEIDYTICTGAFF